MDSILCPECGAANSLESAVCTECGADLSAVKSVIDNAHRHYNEALALAHGGRLDEAIAQLEAALALNNDNPLFHNLMGTLNAQKGLYSEAIRAWERTIALDPEFEKAYHNIEKARNMEEEAAEEEERRPYTLTMYAAIGLAIVFLLASGYFAARLWTKNRMIDSLRQERVTLQNQMQDVRDQAREYEAQVNAMNQLVPEQGINGLLQEYTTLQANLENQKQLNERLRQQNTRIQENYQTRISTLEQEKQQMQQQLQRIGSLEAQIRSQESQLQQKDEQLTSAQEALQTTRSELTVNQQELASARERIEQMRTSQTQELEKLRASYDNNIESLRGQIQQLQDEIAQYEREMADLSYANGLVVESLKNLENNRFELAHQNVLAALERDADHQTAVYVKQEVERILANPLEQELRRLETAEREERRIAQGAELANKLVDQANDSYRKGFFDKAIQEARRAKQLQLEIDPTDDDLIRDAERIVNQSQERLREIGLMMVEAKRLAEQGNTEQGQDELREILEIAPAHSEARELLSQLRAEPVR